MNWHALVIDHQQEGSFWKLKHFIPLILLSPGSLCQPPPSLIIPLLSPSKDYFLFPSPRMIYSVVVKHANTSPAFPFQETLEKMTELAQCVKERTLTKLLVAPGYQSRGSAGPHPVLWFRVTGRESQDGRNQYACMLATRPQHALNAAAQ